mmetsp:Transcript_26677/g.34663  ORF Transcript_26677/g.34663 Transcript_26677/m.34663 type:complete len:256 (+) Transcript_26677:50-817(+)
MDFITIEEGSSPPPNLEASLVENPRFSGHLQTLFANWPWPSHWKTRYFQLYDSYLVYFDYGQQTTTTISKIPLPNGYINLCNVDKIINSGSHLILSYSSDQHTTQKMSPPIMIKLRAHSNSNVIDDPYMCEWLRHLKLSQSHSYQLESPHSNSKHYHEDEEDINHGHGGVELLNRGKHKIKKESSSSNHETYRESENPMLQSKKFNSSNRTSKTNELNNEVSLSIHEEKTNKIENKIPYLLKWFFIYSGNYFLPI